MSAPVANVASASGVTVTGGAQGALRALTQAGNANPFLAFLGNSGLQSGASSAAQTSGNSITLRNGVQVQIYPASNADGTPAFYLANVQSDKFPDDVLMALTKGVPTTQLPQGSATLEPITLDQLTSLMSSDSDALKNGNVLLIAGNFSPEEMEDLANQLSEALRKLENPEPTLPVNGDAELTDADPITDEPEDKSLQFYLVTLQGATSVADSTGASGEECGINEIPKSALPEWARNQDTGESNNDIPEWEYMSAFFPVPAAAASASSSSSASASSGAIAAASAAAAPSPFAMGDNDSLSPFEVAFDSAKAASTLGNSYHAGAKPTGYKSGTLTGHVNSDAQSASTALGLDGSLPADWMTGKIGIDLSQTLQSGAAGLGNQATGTTPAQIATAAPILSYSSAGAAHPVTQAIAARLEKTSENGETKSQAISVELDPPELGRVQIHLSYEKGEPMKVKVLTEKEETLSILRRDSHALREALEHAGVQTDGSSLNFDMSHDQSAFQQTLNSSGQNHSSRGFNLSGESTMSSDIALPLSGLEDISTSLNLVVDDATGHVRYNLLA